MDKPVARPLAAGKPPLPREHGAWGILLIPFATAAGVAGVFDVKTALLLASVLCFYIARTSYLKEIVGAGFSSDRSRESKSDLRRAPISRVGATRFADAPVSRVGRDAAVVCGNGAATRIGWTSILLGASFACTAPLFFFWKLWWLAAFGALAAPLAFRKTGRSVAMQLLAVGGLTLTAPAAWYAGTGRLGTQALLLWLLNALYFAGGVFYVKMHVAAAVGRKPLESLAEKARLGAAVIAYHLGLVIVLLALAAGGVVSFPVLLAYAPVVVRAFAGIARLSPTLRIRRLGWTEVAYSVVYAIVLIAAFRFG